MKKNKVQDFEPDHFGLPKQTAGGGGGTQIQSDWIQSDDTRPDFIKHKPAISQFRRLSPTTGGPGLSYIYFHFEEGIRCFLPVDASKSFALNLIIDNNENNIVHVRNIGSSDVKITCNVAQRHDDHGNLIQLTTYYSSDISVPVGGSVLLTVLSDGINAFITKDASLLML